MQETSIGSHEMQSLAPEKAVSDRAAICIF